MRKTALALLALAADDRKWHDDAVAFLELSIDAPANLDDLSHHLMAHDVAGFHERHEAVEKMQIGAADAGGRDADDRVAAIENEC